MNFSLYFSHIIMENEIEEFGGGSELIGTRLKK